MKSEIKDTYIKIITKSDGKPYKVRKNRNRYFFPDEWEKFEKSFTTKKQKENFMVFDFQFNTGGRIEEILFIRPKDYNDERQTIRFWKTKTKSKKGETEGKDRTIQLSTEFSKRLKKYMKNYEPNEYIFKFSVQSVWQMLRRRLQKVCIKDYDNFATHNIRKTHGNYLKAIGVPIEEICFRLSHDYNTFLKHYGSSNIFTNEEIYKIQNLMGDLKIKIVKR